MKPKLIINGGAPLKDCPTSYKQADEWEAEANETKESYVHPMWKWDCGYKLDYDGPIIRISSRFYPPKSHYGPTWDGIVDVYMYDSVLTSKKFDCSSLDGLKSEVEEYIKSISLQIKAVLTKTILT